jgi:DNA-binding response OmpR family regulator
MNWNTGKTNLSARRTDVISGLCAADSPPRLVIAEDDETIRTALAEVFVMDGFEVTFVTDGEALVEHLEECRDVGELPDMIVLDHRMPGLCGLDVLEALKANEWPTPVILMTAFGSEVSDAAASLGVSAILDKPFDVDVLRTFVDCLIDLPGPGRRRLAMLSTSELPGTPRCAACQSSERVRFDDKVPGILFCAQCWARAAPPEPEDELGVGD